MKSKISSIIVLAVIFVTFSIVNSAKAAQKSAQQYSTAVLKDGGGPLCIPHTPCGYKNGVSASGTNLPTRVLLAAGPGPMCPPGIECVARHIFIDKQKASTDSIARR